MGEEGYVCVVKETTEGANISGRPKIKAYQE